MSEQTPLVVLIPRVLNPFYSSHYPFVMLFLFSAVFLGSHVALVAAATGKDNTECPPPSTDPLQFAGRELDYIVIGKCTHLIPSFHSLCLAGGGVGGLTVASRYISILQ